MTTPADPAGARLASLDHRHGWQLGIFGVAATVMFVTIFQVGTAIRLFGTGESAITVDFYVFWAAAKLAVQGVPFDAFDVTRLQQAAGVTDTDWMPWAYPPGLMMVLMPLGLLPFAAAWAVFEAVSVIALGLAVRPFSTGRFQVLLAAAFAPAALPCLLVGQTTLLWIAGLLAALAALRANRPVLAGVFVGLLTLKPQLGILLPLALLACGAWRTILSAIVTTAVVAAVPTWLFGSAYWPVMLEMMAAHGDAVRESIAGNNRMISPYAALAGAGVAEPLALALQWAVTAVCALVVFLVWRAPAAAFDLRAAVLFTAIPLASPYLWFYGSAFLAPAVLFMWRAGALGLRPAAMLLGLAMWLGLGPSTLIALNSAPGLEVFRFYFVLINATALLVCLRCVLRGTEPTRALPQKF